MACTKTIQFETQDLTPLLKSGLYVVSKPVTPVSLVSRYSEKNAPELFIWGMIYLFVLERYNVIILCLIHSVALSICMYMEVLRKFKLAFNVCLFNAYFVYSISMRLSSTVSNSATFPFNF
jgi:hypothetical protein